MKEWRRVPVYTRCGLCGNEIPKDTPALFIKLVDVKRERIRCPSCVGEAPPDLPTRVVLRGETVDGVRSGTTKRMQPLARAIPRDYTNRLLGESE